MTHPTPTHPHPSASEVQTLVGAGLEEGEVSEVREALAQLAAHYTDDE